MIEIDKARKKGEVKRDKKRDWGINSLKDWKLIIKETERKRRKTGRKWNIIRRIEKERLQTVCVV